jgi:glycosyl transferase family 87
VNPFRSPYTVALIAGAIGVALALSVEQGLSQHVGHDFHVFWQAGRNFTAGDALYHGYLPGARKFKYPPFAALVFQPLGVLPLSTAAVLFSLLNLALWVVAIFLTRDIVAQTSKGRDSIWVPVALAGVLTAQFFLDNFHHVQMNEVILVLILLGIRAYLRERDLAAAAYVVTATSIKLSPIFFVAWLLIRGRRRAALSVLPLAAACVLVPLLVRGPATGAADLREYYESFLAGHQHAEIRSYTRGHNIATFVNRVMLPEQSTTDGSRERTAQLIYRAGWAAVAIVFLARLVQLRLRGAPPSSFEFSMTFLACLLLSPITFTAHLVFLLFVFCAFLSVRVATIPPGGRLLAGMLLVAMAMSGLSGRDLVGRAANLFVIDHGIFVLTILLLFVASVALAGRESAPARADNRDGLAEGQPVTGAS